jgi:hypothetical protein
MKIESKTTIRVTLDGATFDLTREDAETLLQHLKNALGDRGLPIALPEKVQKWEPAFPWNPSDWRKLYGTSWPPGTVLCTT